MITGSVGSYIPNRGHTGDSYAWMKDLEEFYNNVQFLRDQQTEINRNLKDNSNTEWYFRVLLGVLGYSRPSRPPTIDSGSS